MKTNNSEGHISLNLGIQILRAILCLWVLFSHCAKIKKEHLKYFKKNYHVPTFFILSFYFFYPILVKRNSIAIKKRFQRLLFPYFFWPIFVFILNNLLVHFTSLGKVKDKLSLKELYLQILTGSQYYRVFWFQFTLIYLSLVFSLISFIFKKKLLIFLEFLGIISLNFHFAQINRKIFETYEKNIKWSLGRVNEALPLAIVGCIYSSINLISKINNITLYSFFILLDIIYLLFNYDLFQIFPGFSYSNTLSYILASTVFVLFFSSLKFDKYIILKTIIMNITKYTGGIYYIHVIFYKYIFFFFKIKKTSYFFSFIVYVICYIICFSGNKLFKNNIFKYLII